LPIRTGRDAGCVLQEQARPARE